MNIYKVLNGITKYIDEHLEEKIDYEPLSKMMGVNTYTMQRIFTLLTNVSLSEYIRKRKLSMAGYDLATTNAKVIDIAIKYNYENPTSFSRAFTLFHGIKPSKVRENTKLKDFPRIVFKEEYKTNEDIEYSIIEKEKIVLYGLFKSTTFETIKEDAPNFCCKMNLEYGDFDYAMILYEDRFNSNKCEYWVLFNHQYENFEKVEIPKSKYLRFKVSSQNAKEIQNMSDKFYKEFLPSCKYNLRPLPELEYYHDGITEFLVPIY